MKYLGSKAKIASEILPLILAERTPLQTYVEPFIGGANTFSRVFGRRIGGDSNPYLIALYRALAEGWEPPEFVTEQTYYRMKNYPEQFPPELVGYAGFALSFGCMWFNSLARDDIRSPETRSGEGYRDVMKLKGAFIGAELHSMDYRELAYKIPPESLIYCDPPYEGVKEYNGQERFDSEEFWQWCRVMTERGHTLYISELNAPPDFEVVWQQDKMRSFASQRKVGWTATEKLFTLKNQVLTLAPEPQGETEV